MEEKQLKKLVKSLTLDEKAAQLTQLNGVYVKTDSQAAITGLDTRLTLTKKDVFRIGSVLNFYDFNEVKEIQDIYLAEAEKKIPLLMMFDVIHGYRTIFPIPLALGATFDTQLVEDCAEMSAVEAKYDGVQVTFAPMVDLSRDARWGRQMETTGEDPYLNGEMGKAFVRGYHKGGLACCIKHFAAYGQAEAGRDYNTTDISPTTLRNYYLYAYGECMKEKPEMVMSSFNMLNGVPVNGHSELLVDLLRGEWGFDGVVISDYSAILEMVAHGYLETEKKCAETALNNQVDIEMVSSTYINYLPELVEEGRIKERQVDKMVERVLSLKNRLGLFENPYYEGNAQKAQEAFLCDEYRELARTAAEKSFVLLKNEGVLPLDKKEKIACVGPFANEKDVIGAWAAKGRAEESVTVLEGLESYLDCKIPYAKGVDGELLAVDESGVKGAVKAAKKAKTVILCIGEKSADSGEGASRAELKIPAVQINLLKALKKAKKKVVALVFGGRAQVLTEVEELADAILYVWQPGTECGRAVARVLYGDVNPSGKLTVSFPRATGQCPIYYNAYSTGRQKPKDDFENIYYVSSYRDVLNAPLYPFGYGLSYTRFEISDLQLSSNQLTEEGEIEVSVVVKNVGDRAGDEVIQLYIRDQFASIVRPVKELKGYQKISLKAGEEMRVNFTLTEKDLRFYNAKLENVAEAGKFSVFVGNSSVDVLESEFELVK